MATIRQGLVCPWYGTTGDLHLVRAVWTSWNAMALGPFIVQDHARHAHWLVWPPLNALRSRRGSLPTSREPDFFIRRLNLTTSSERQNSILGNQQPAESVSLVPAPTRPAMTALYPGCDLNVEQLVSALTKAMVTDNGLLRG